MFTPKTLAFIAENRGRNSKEWFTSHKDEYNELVRDPLLGLAETLAPAMNEIDSRIITDPKNSVSRIHCDMRFSKDMLYREMLWISFRRDKKAYPGWPEFFFVFTPREFFYGCGYYSASAGAMEAVRGLILADSPAFRAAKEAYETQDLFKICGDMYKRSRYPDYSEELKEWLDRKTICFSYAPEDIREMFSPDLPEKMSTSYLHMKPVYDFLVFAEETAAVEKHGAPNEV